MSNNIEHRAFWEKPQEWPKMTEKELIEYWVNLDKVKAIDRHEIAGRQYSHLFYRIYDK